METNYLTIWTDGGARGNPGPAGIGAVLAADDLVDHSESSIIGTISEYIGQTTNNQAEYRALQAALNWTTDYLKKEGRDQENIWLKLYTDSELMAYQIQGKYKVKNADLAPLYQDVFQKLQNFAGYKIEPIRREKNQAADRLVNKAIDAALTNSAH